MVSLKSDEFIAFRHRMQWQDLKVSLCQDRRRVCDAPSGPGRFSDGKGLGK